MPCPSPTESNQEVGLILTVATCLLVLATACAGGPASDPALKLPTEVHHYPSFEALDGQFVTSEPTIVVPNRNWGADLERGLWKIRASAAIHLQLREPPDKTLAFVMTVEEGDPHELECSWDGAILPPSAITIRGDTVSAIVPPEMPTPGVHAFSVSRVHSPRLASTAEEVTFSYLAYRLGDHEKELTPERVHGYRYVAAFLGHGVTGSYTHELLGGFLFRGPRTAVVENLSERSGSCRVIVHNSSADLAVFRMRHGDSEAHARVESHGKALFELPIQARALPLEFAVEGREDGFYLWGVPHLQRAGRQAQPPIFLITLDTTRRDAVPPFSNRPDLTPNLAGFADHAVVYERAVSTAPWTLPSHASMFTGLYPSRHRAGVTEQELSLGIPTAALILRSHGYVTAGFAGGFFCASRFGLGRGFMSYLEPEDFEIPADALTDAVLEFLAAYGDRPLFVFANYFDPHFPFRAPEHLRPKRTTQAGKDALSGSSDLEKVMSGDGGAWMRAIQGELQFNDAALAELKDRYLAEVAFVDEQLGRLFGALRDRDLYEEALIVVVADHGELLGENGMFGHGCRLDNELISVPLLIKFPHQTARVTMRELVSVNDIFPTLLDAAGVAPPVQDGLGLRPELSAELRTRSVVYSEEHGMGIHQLFPHMKIADHLYGIERTDRREIVWEEGISCYRRAGGSWIAGGCELTREGALQLVYRHLPPARESAADARSNLSEVEKDKLRALGYLE